MNLKIVDASKNLLNAVYEPNNEPSAEPLQIIEKSKSGKNGKNGTVSNLELMNLANQSIKNNTQTHYPWHIVWRNVIAFLYLHAFSLYGVYLVLFQAKILTTAFAIFLGGLGGQGITAGAHRLWAHRTYKARLPLRIFLAILQTFAFQNHLYEWVRDHRVHHKFTDTDADPHNARRGFFFSHIGWLMLKKHKDVFLKGKQVDLSDLRADPVVMFQKKYYLILMPLLCFVIPTLIPYYFWDETLWNAWHIASVLRYTVSLNITWLVNSAAHIWGMKPYDKNIAPTENIFVSLVAQGEGWHNYHHVFPWDYRAAELGSYMFNMTTLFLNIMEMVGLAYDLKVASPEMIESRSKRTGDGSRKAQVKTKNGKLEVIDFPELNDEHLWGWGDRDMKDEDIETVLKSNNIRNR